MMMFFAAAAAAASDIDGDSGELLISSNAEHVDAHGGNELISIMMVMMIVMICRSGRRNLP